MRSFCSQADYIPHQTKIQVLLWFFSPFSCQLSVLLRLLLGTRHGQAFHERPLREAVQDDQRNTAEQYGDGDQLQLASVRHDHRLGDVAGEIAAHPADHRAHLHGESPVARQEIPGIEQIRPLPHKAEQEAAGNRRDSIRQHDLHKGVHRAAAVHIGRLLQAHRDILEILTHHVDEQPVLQAHAGQAHDNVGRHRGPQVHRITRERLDNPKQVKLSECDIQGCLDGLRRDDDQQHHAGKPELFQREFIPGKPVSHQGRCNDLADRDHNGDPQRVDHGFRKTRQVCHNPIVVQRHMARQQDDSGVVQVPLLHQTHGKAGQHGLDDHKAQAEHQQCADNGNHDLLDPALQQVSFTAAVPGPEVLAFPDEYRIVLTHKTSPPL